MSIKPCFCNKSKYLSLAKRCFFVRLIGGFLALSLASVFLFGCAASQGFRSVPSHSAWEKGSPAYVRWMQSPPSQVMV